MSENMETTTDLIRKFGWSEEKAKCLVCGNEFYLGFWLSEDCPKRGMATNHEISEEDGIRFMEWQRKNKKNQ